MQRCSFVLLTFSKIIFRRSLKSNRESKTIPRCFWDLINLAVIGVLKFSTKNKLLYLFSWIWIKFHIPLQYPSTYSTPMCVLSDIVWYNFQFMTVGLKKEAFFEFSTPYKTLLCVLYVSLKIPASFFYFFDMFMAEWLWIIKI